MPHLLPIPSPTISSTEVGISTEQMKRRAFSRVGSFTYYACAIFLMVGFPATLAFADNAFRWEDQQGTLHFGNQPPKGAKNVTPLNSKGLSKYSTKKVFKGYGIPYAEDVPQEAIDSFDISDRNIAPELERGELVVKHDEQQRLTVCSLLINNKSDSTAQGISVVFEFPDGSRVPAMGPKSLAPETGAIYEIPKNLIPLKIAGDFEKPIPTVSIKNEGA